MAPHENRRRPPLTDPRKGTAGPLANFAALGSSEVLGRIAGFYATILVARNLGVDNFGILGFATAVMSYFGIALTVGFGDIGAREVARDPASARRFAADATAIRLLLALAGIGATALIAFAFVSSPVQRTVLLVSTITLIAVALDTTWVYRGLSQNRAAGGALLLAQLAYLAGVVVFVQKPDDVVRVPLIQFAGDLLAASVLLVMLFNRGVPRPSLSGGTALLRQSGFITVSRLLRALIVTFDVLLLAALSGTHDVGLYTAAYRICLLVTTIAVATHVVFLPGVATSALEGMTSLSQVVTRSISLTSSVIFPLAAGGIALAGPLLVLLFGDEYASAATAFRLLLASIALLSLHGTGHNVFVALHQTRKEAVIFGVAAAVNIILNFALIPRYGLDGAAFATLAAEALILVMSAIALRLAGLVPLISRILLPLIASLTMAGALTALSDRFPVWVLIPLGGIMYLAVLGATGGIRRVVTDSRSSLR